LLKIKAEGKPHPIHKEYKKYSIYVHWEGYGEKERSWEPLESIHEDCPIFVQNFFNVRGYDYEVISSMSTLVNDGRTYYQNFMKTAANSRKRSVTKKSFGGSVDDILDIDFTTNV
jgi:hypothetical protein